MGRGNYRRKLPKSRVLFHTGKNKKHHLHKKALLKRKNKVQPNAEDPPQQKKRGRPRKEKIAVEKNV